MTDSAQHLADLKAFKAKLVEDRRAIVRKELDAVNRGGDILPSKFLEIQGELKPLTVQLRMKKISVVTYHHLSRFDDNNALVDAPFRAPGYRTTRSTNFKSLKYEPPP